MPPGQQSPAVACLPRDGFCLVNEPIQGCFREGTRHLDPAKPCLSCQPQRNPFDWSIAVGLPCSDGNACTRLDACQADGVCRGLPVICDAPDQCHVGDTCDPATGCSNDPVPDGTPCDADDPCTINAVCTGGVCGGTPKSCPGTTQCCRKPGNHLGQCVAKQACENSGKKDKAIRQESNGRRNKKRGRGKKADRGSRRTR